MSQRITVVSTGFRKTLLFIHGFGKDNSSWETTETGKSIGIVLRLKDTYNVLLLHILYEDYSNIDFLCQEVISGVSNFNNIGIVAHSWGSFVAMKLSISNPKMFPRLLLLDPCYKSPDYYEYLLSRVDPLSVGKVIDYPNLPEVKDIPNDVIVRAHVNITGPKSLDRITFLTPATNRNTKGRVVVHSDVGHCIHYSCPDVVIDAIRELNR